MHGIVFKIIAALLIGLLMPPVAEAGLLFHATKKAAARKIMQRGFSTRLMKPNARFGKGIYTSESKALAFKEKPNSDAIVVLKDTKMLQRYKIDTDSLTKGQFKKLSGGSDMRGGIHKGIIGPKQGKEIGRNAGKGGQIIVFPSKTGSGKNSFIPEKVYQEHPKIIRPIKVIER